MTPDRVLELTSAGESLATEFKSESAHSLSESDLLDAVVCMANRQDDVVGYVLIGIEDDGRISGARPRHGATTNPRHVEALIANRTRPSLMCRVAVVDVQGLPVLVVEVPSSRSPIGTTDGKYVRRALGHRGHPECVPFHFHEMQARQA